MFESIDSSRPNTISDERLNLQRARKIGSQLGFFRREFKLSTDDCAKSLGVEPDYLIEVEQGKAGLLEDQVLQNWSARIGLREEFTHSLRREGGYTTPQEDIYFNNLNAFRLRSAISKIHDSSGTIDVKTSLRGALMVRWAILKDYISNRIRH